MKFFNKYIFIVCLFFSKLMLSTSVSADSGYGIKDFIIDSHFSAFHSVFANWQDQILSSRLGINVEYCEVETRLTEKKFLRSQRPGLVLCLYEHMLQQWAAPRLAVDIIAWAKFQRQPGQKDLIPLRMKFKVKSLPQVTTFDRFSGGISYLWKLRDSLVKWKDVEISIETIVGPIPVDFVLPKDEELSIKYRALAKREDKIQKAVFKVKTFLPGEKLGGRCEGMRLQSKDQSLLCIEFDAYAEKNQDPALSATLATNWSASGDVVQRSGVLAKTLKLTSRLKDLKLHFLLPGLAVLPDSNELSRHLRDIQIRLSINPDALDEELDLIEEPVL